MCPECAPTQLSLGRVANATPRSRHLILELAVHAGLLPSRTRPRRYGNEDKSLRLRVTIFIAPSNMSSSSGVTWASRQRGMR
jgi:hypothetical protein